MKTKNELKAKIRFVNRQRRELMYNGEVPCGCGVSLLPQAAYKCLYCAEWYCVSCAEKHFGKTIAEHMKEHPEPHLNQALEEVGREMQATNFMAVLDDMKHMRRSE